MNSMKTKDKHEFGGNREIAIQRDGEKCVKCGMTRQQHKDAFGRDITVDHIDGKGRYTLKSNKNNTLDNLQTLCLSCHGKKDVARRSDKLTPDDVRDIRLFREKGIRCMDIARVYGVTPENITMIVTGKSWKNLTAN